MESAIADIGLFFAYPWPEEREQMQELFEAVARERAMLVVYHTDTDIRVFRKVEDKVEREGSRAHGYRQGRCLTLDHPACASWVAGCAQCTHGLQQGQKATLGTGSAARAPTSTPPAIAGLVCSAVPWRRLPGADPTAPVCRCWPLRWPRRAAPARRHTRHPCIRCTQVDNSLHPAYG